MGRKSLYLTLTALQETLRRRQQAFKKTEKEIEARLAAEEENEDQYNVQQENHIGNTSCRDTGMY